MRHLGAEHWESFTADKNLKGLLFEDLVEKLLPTVRRGRWHRTKQSHDRGRDFWLRTRGETFAAECKMYRDRIAIQVLSKTLVMAVVDDWARILFFSFSRLNLNTRKHLTQFQARTGKLIEVFDDEKLEDLILRTPAALREFFPSFKRVSIETGARKLVVSDYLSRDPDVDYLTLPDEDAVGVIGPDLYETVCFDIFLSNDSLTTVEGEIVLDHDRFATSLQLLDRDVVDGGYRIPFTIGEAGVFTRRLYFKLIQPGRVSLPRYSIATADGVTIEDRRSQAVLDVRGLLRPPMIGKRFHRTWDEIRRAVTARDRPLFVCLHGRSGTGKTRLSSELRDVIVGAGYTAFRFAGENTVQTTFDDLLRGYVARRFHLPRAMALEDVGDRPSRHTLPPLIFRILYDRGYVPSEHVEECLALLEGSFVGRKTALLIDDLQSFDPLTVEVLNRLMTNFHGTAERLVVLFTLNTDLAVAASEPARLPDRMRELERGEGAAAARQFYVMPVLGFSKADAKSFLDHCFAQAGTPPAAMFTASYPQTAELLIRKSQRTPLYLEQVLYALHDAGAIVRDEESMRIEDIDAFHALIEKMPGNVAAVVRRRWEFTEEKVGPNATALLRVLALLVYLPKALAGRWGFGQQTISALRQLAFLREDERDVIVFHHQTLFRFFKATFGLGDRDWAANMLARFDEPLLLEYPAQYFLLIECVRGIDGADLRRGIEAIELDHAAGEYLTEFADAFNRATVVCEPTDRKRMLTALRTSGQRVKSRVGFGEAYRVFGDIAKRELTHPERYRRYGREFFRLAVACANIHITVREDWGSIGILQRALHEFGGFDFRDERTRIELECALLNRLCVAQRSLSLRDEALQTGRRSLAEAIAANLPHLVAQDHVDLGYVYYGRLADRPDLLREWSAAIASVQPDDIPSAMITGPNVWYYHRAHVLTLQEAYVDALAAIDDAEQRCIRSLDVFHRVKLLTLRVVVELLAGRSGYRAMLDALAVARDLCVRHNARQTYWVTFHALAKVAWRRNDVPAMRRATAAAFRQLMSFLRHHPEMQERYHEAFADLAILARASGATLRDDDVNAIAATPVRTHVHSVLAFSDPEFRRFCDSHEPAATYHDGRFDLPCP